MAPADHGLRPLSRALPALVAAGLLLTGCTAGQDQAPRVVQGTSVAEPGPSCSPSPVMGSALPETFPVDVALPPGAELTEVGAGRGFALASGRTAGTVEEVLEHFRTALPQAGLFVGRDEDEGRAGELTFLGGSTEGAVTVARLRCPEGAVSFTLSARSTR